MSIEISILISVVAVCISFITVSHNLKKDSTSSITANVEQVTKINMKLDEACRNTMDIKGNVTLLSNQVNEIKEELIVQKQEIKALWKNVDKLNDQDVNQ